MCCQIESLHVIGICLQQLRQRLRQQLRRQLYDLSALAQECAAIDAAHVKAHAGHGLNELADGSNASSDMMAMCGDEYFRLGT